MNKLMMAVMVTSSVVSMPLLADSKKMLDSDSFSASASASLGWLGGESKEYVYDEGYKLSELKWKIKNTAIIKGDLSWNAFDFATLNLRGWSTLASSGSGMDDYDWYNPSQSHWTNWSTHPNTRLNYANEFDANLKVWALNTPDYRLGGVFGYQQTRLSWTAVGGRYNYYNGAVVGDFPRGMHVIGYQQKFSMPYIGIAGLYRYEDFEFNALLKFSPWVTARDNDEHYLRSLTFHEKANNSRYYSAALDAGYYVTPNAKVYAEVSYSKYKEGKGGTEIINYENGTIGYEGGEAAGIANKTYTVTVGLQYRF